MKRGRISAVEKSSNVLTGGEKGKTASKKEIPQEGKRGKNFCREGWVGGTEFSENGRATSTEVPKKDRRWGGRSQAGEIKDKS